MKKALKTITSALLIAIIAFGSTVAAFATGEPIEWVVTELEMSRYFTCGNTELELGTTKIRNTNHEENLVYFDFEAEESGYYLIDTDVDSWVYVPESYGDGKAYNYAEGTQIGDEEQRIFFIEKGKTVIGVNFYENSSDKIRIEFMGEDVADFTIEEEALKNYIIGWDFCESDPEYIGIVSDTVITFTNGNTVTVEDYYFEGTTDGSPNEGENKATLSFLGKSKEVTFTAYKVESMVESAEVTNIENYLTVQESYDGYIYVKPIHTETLTVNYTDGTSETAILCEGYAQVTLPCGKTVSAYVGEHWDEDDRHEFVIKVAGTVIERYEYKVEKQTLAENLVELKDNNQSSFEDAKVDFMDALTSLTSDLDWAKINFRWSIQSFFQLFTNMINFIKYYI